MPPLTREKKKRRNNLYNLLIFLHLKFRKRGKQPQPKTNSLN